VNANTDLTGAPLPPEDSNSSNITGHSAPEHHRALPDRFPPRTPRHTGSDHRVRTRRCLPHRTLHQPNCRHRRSLVHRMMLVLIFLSVPVAIALSVPSIIGVYADPASPRR
jgi:C4-dicarboxylate transporter DctM subunit